MSQSLSVVIITLDEEANISRTLASVAELVKQTAGEIIVVDSGSTDRTVEIAKSFGAKVYVEPWKGYAAQKNSAIDKASGDWILSLDADEEVSPPLSIEIPEMLVAEEIWRREGMPTGDSLEETSMRDRGLNQWALDEEPDGFEIPRRNLFLGKWIKHGGFYPDRKLRLFRRGTGRVEERAVHETIKMDGCATFLKGGLIHHAYPTLQSYIGHMNKYSTLGAEMAVAERPRGFSLWNIVVRPWATFIYNYFFRLGFLDGKEGLLLHMYHAIYVSWKYAKAWELSRKQRDRSNKSDSALA
jgi:glycosyltransferase involved in cell wall biosynthesis